MCNGEVIQLTHEELEDGDYEFNPSDYDPELVEEAHDQYVGDFGFMMSSEDFRATDWSGIPYNRGGESQSIRRIQALYKKLKVSTK